MTVEDIALEVLSAWDDRNTPGALNRAVDKFTRQEICEMYSTIFPNRQVVGVPTTYMFVQLTERFWEDDEE